jgi:hypothetical protein
VQAQGDTISPKRIALLRRLALMVLQRPANSARVPVDADAGMDYLLALEALLPHMHGEGLKRWQEEDLAGRAGRMRQRAEFEDVQLPPPLQPPSQRQRQVLMNLVSGMYMYGRFDDFLRIMAA